jgi:serine O-acetyltransferase
MHLRQTVRSDCRRFAALSGRPSDKVRLGLLLNPRVFPVVLIRVSAKLQSANWRRLANMVTLINLIVFRIEVPARAVIGEGFVLPHPGGIVLGSASIGDNVTIFQNVTIGARSFEADYDLRTRPVIGSGVTLGAGAVVLGPVAIGDNATVAANSLVVEDVPSSCTAMGVPATARQQRKTDQG